MFSLSQVTRLLCLYILRCILFGTRLHSSGMRTACLLTVCVCVCVCVCVWVGVSAGGCLPRCVPARGCLPSGGVCLGGVCLGRCLPRGGVCPGGCLPRGCLPRSLPGGGGVPCYLSHHTFDVTCMLPPHQLRPSNSAAAYVLLVGHVT